MKTQLATLSIITVVLFLSSMTPAFAVAPSLPASGTFPPTTVISAKYSNDLKTIHLVSKGPITGTFSGEYYSAGNVSVANNGLSATYVAIDVCYCNFTDTHGITYGVTTFLEKGAVVVTDIRHGTGPLLSVAEIVNTTIPGLSGAIVFNGTANVFTNVNYGIYTGLVTDP